MSFIRGIVKRLVAAEERRDLRHAAPMSGYGELYLTTQDETEAGEDLELLRSLCR